MKNLFKSALSLSILSMSLSASTLYLSPNLETELNKMNNYIDSVMNTHFNNSTYMRMSYPKVNMYSHKDDYLIQFNIAGLEKDEIKLSINQDNVLTLEGESKTEVNDNNDSILRQEIFYGKFKRTLQLPDNINQEKLSTKFENGILTVIIEKKEADKPISKVIEIK
mgnify:CR=1 FL=1